jgi:hypothetical protein
MPSKETVERAVLLWEVTARPTQAAAPMAMVSLPTCVQAVPFAETNEVNTLPVLRNRTCWIAVTGGTAYLGDEYGAAGMLIGAEAEFALIIARDPERIIPGGGQRKEAAENATHSRASC